MRVCVLRVRVCNWICLLRVRELRVHMCAYAFVCCMCMCVLSVCVLACMSNKVSRRPSVRRP
jgi:hypothetical protein